MDEARIAELLDREAIRDCLFRYCRGIDRADEQTLRGVYWADATDQHGPYSGSAGGFIGFAAEVFKTQPRNIHQISNILIEFTDAANAVVESYFNALQRSRGDEGKEQQVLLCGRYCDRFQKRDGEWRIAERLVVYDWVDEQTPPSTSEEERFAVRKPIGTSWPDDPIYRLLANSCTSVE